MVIHRSTKRVVVCLIHYFAQCHFNYVCIIIDNHTVNLKCLCHTYTHTHISTIISANSIFLYTHVGITSVQLSFFWFYILMHQCWSSIWVSVWYSSPISFEKAVNITIIDNILMYASHCLGQRIPMPNEYWDEDLNDVRKKYLSKQRYPIDFNKMWNFVFLIISMKHWPLHFPLHHQPPCQQLQNVLGYISTDISQIP